MLATERRHLLGRAPKPWHPSVEAAQPVRLIGRFRVWPWPEAADEFRARVKAYLPDLPALATFRPQPKPGPRRTPQTSAARRIPVEA